MHYFSHKKHTQGISLLEALFVLVIIAIMTLAVITYVRQAQRQTQITALMAQMRGLIEAAEDYNNANGSFDGISATKIVKMHTIVPRYNVIIGNALISPWTGLSSSDTEGSNITVGSINEGEKIEIGLHQLPYFACQQVLEQLSNFTSVYNTAGKAVSGSLSTFCVNARVADDNTLGVTVYLHYPKD